MWNSQKSPNFHYFTVIVLGIFEQFLAKPHLVARLNVTFSTFGRCMSGTRTLNICRNVQQFNTKITTLLSLLHYNYRDDDNDNFITTISISQTENEKTCFLWNE